MVEPSLSLSESTSLGGRFLLSRSLALGLDARPALVFLGLGTSPMMGAGVEGVDLAINLSFGPPGVELLGVGAAPGVAEGVARDGSLGTPVLSFNLMPLILMVVVWQAFQRDYKSVRRGVFQSISNPFEGRMNGCWRCVLGRENVGEAAAALC